MASDLPHPAAPAGAAPSDSAPGGRAAGHHGAPARPGDAPAPAPISAPQSAEMLTLLETRRSLPLRALVPPGPSPGALARMLAVAARVPDHGRLVPWRFIVIEGEARRVAGARLDALYLAQNPQLAPDKRQMWHDYLLRAPVTVVVVSRPDPASRIPVFNQVLSAGAAAMNLISAATALGFGAQWLLKWPGRDKAAAALLGVGDGEQVAGFVHIGRPAETPPDRPQPALADVVTHWRP
ncbi:nitroreductase [Xanthobacter sp. KR7-225]|uniref:nitroreductase family protein n=1 Tax=Xanthobacter sp. KR7-225 TaxID=3156613 RepID=UPI0032B4A9C8